MFVAWADSAVPSESVGIRQVLTIVATGAVKFWFISMVGRLIRGWDATLRGDGDARA
jgi:hypothetical protein